MDSLLNLDRPPVFCPGCTHDAVTRAIDKALVRLGLAPEKTCIVTDIGCSGLLDTFFKVNAFHGTHGRALTYATGLKLADPSLTVIVTMGDGGLGIGGAHALAACRRNLDLTLIILNNLNFGMTGGQCSLTTPAQAVSASGFLNRAEIPADICRIAESAGATYIERCSGLDKSLPQKIADAVSHKGFSIVETLGICTGRFTRKNKMTAAEIKKTLSDLPAFSGPVRENLRPEYGALYNKLTGRSNLFPDPVSFPLKKPAKNSQKHEILILGSAGMHIITAGDLLCHAGLHAGLNVSVKSEHNVTVLRGPCVSEVILSPNKIGFTGLQHPDIVLALSKEGVDRRQGIFQTLNSRSLVIKKKDVTIPGSPARVMEIDFKKMGIRREDFALASLALLAKENLAVGPKTLTAAVKSKFTKELAQTALSIIKRATGI